mgnify:CR=1 FL=1
MIFLFVLCLFLSIDIFISLCSSLCDDHKRSKKHSKFAEECDAVA